MNPKQRREWLETRKRGLGGTDMAAIMGIHPYKTPMSVYAEKLGLMGEGIPTEAMKLGLALEPVIAKLYTEETGMRLVHAPHARMFSDKYKWVMGTPDRLTRDGKLVVELKSVGSRQAWRFGEHGTSEVPKWHFVQVQQYLMILNMPFGHLAALIGGNEFRIFNIEADKELQDMMLGLGEKFMVDHVWKKVPPPPTGLPIDTALIKRLNQVSGGEMKAAIGEIEEALSLLYKGNDIEKEFKEKNEGVRNLIKQAIGTADGIEGLDYIATWRKSKDGTKVNTEAVIQALVREFEVPEWILNNIIEEHTEIRPGSRRFFLKKKNGGK